MGLPSNINGSPVFLQYKKDMLTKNIVFFAQYDNCKGNFAML